MFRVEPSILGGMDTSPDRDGAGLSLTATVDADVIATAALTGFAASRVMVGNPVRFEYEDESDRESNEASVEFLRSVLVDRGIVRADAADKSVTVGVTRPWTQGGLITGAVGAANTPFERRNAVPTSTVAEEVRQLAASLEKEKLVGYQGKGAYTGFVDDPWGDSGSISSTMRQNAPEQGFGDRWTPPSYHYATGQSQDEAPWGLINDGRPIATMKVEDPQVPGVVGYVHGMVQAIYTSLAKGPWCTPFEIAVGRETTKLASCFACTLFMYAAGFPPSATHLGRGDSWMPFYPLDSGARGHSVTDLGISAANARWYMECRQLLKLGGTLLEGALRSPEHADRLPRLDEFLESRSKDAYCGGNLVLDALTVPGKVSDRVVRAIGVTSRVHA